MVSVIIPSYNRAGTLRRSMDSVLAQTYRNLEVIVVDDGSTDDTEAVVRAIPDPRVRYVRQPNQGACAARNNGIDHAKGDHIAFHDSDDVWLPDKLEKQMHAMQAHDAAIVCCRLIEHQKDGSCLLIPQVFPEGFHTAEDNLFGIGTQTLLARREVFAGHRFDPEMPRFQEFDLLCRITRAHPVYCMPEALVEYSISPDSISANPAKLMAACDLLEKKHPALFSHPSDARTTLAYRLESEAVLALNAGDPLYRTYLRRACAYHSGRRKLMLSILSGLGLFPVYLTLRARIKRRT